MYYVIYIYICVHACIIVYKTCMCVRAYMSVRKFNQNYLSGSLCLCPSPSKDMRYVYLWSNTHHVTHAASPSTQPNCRAPPFRYDGGQPLAANTHRASVSTTRT